MREHNTIKKLQEPVDIPPVVLEKSQQAFEKIKAEAGQETTYRAVRKRKSPRRIWVAAAAAAALLGTVSVGAAVYSQWWSKGLSETLHANEEQMQKLDADKAASSVNQAVTDQGVTITAVQSIVDNYYAHLSFKVEGYELAQGAEPGIDSIEVTVDGEDADWNGGFYNGLVSGENGEAVYADGTEIEFTEDGSLVERYVQEDGSLEYDITLMDTSQEGAFFGKTVRVVFTDLGTYEKTEFAPVVEGNWELEWTLQGSGEMRTCQLEVPLGESGVTVQEAQVSPISLRVISDVPKDPYGQAMEDPESLCEPPALTGVVMKDGTVYPYLYLGPGQQGYESEDSTRYLDTFAIDRILDVDQVESLLFRKEILSEEDLPSEESGGEELPLEERFYVVPLS